MYPFLRLGLETLLARRAPPLPLDGVHVSRHTCWPWDLDPWRELNNGRALTLYDLGRLPLVMRTGVAAALGARGWGITIAGSSVRYRRRVRAFQRIEMRSRLLGRDARFFYVQQAMFRGGEALSAALLRSAVTSADGIVPTDRVVAALGRGDWDPPLPDWVAAWSAAEALRPWPPR
jgi:acyl-CoA thioesterase FadM